MENFLVLKYVIIISITDEFLLCMAGRTDRYQYAFGLYFLRTVQGGTSCFYQKPKVCDSKTTFVMTS